MNKNVAEATTLPELMKPFNRSEIARELTARGFPTSRDRIARMALGKTVPQVRELPALAEILRIDFTKLAQIVAQQAA